MKHSNNSIHDELLLEIMQEQKYNMTKDGLYVTLVYGERKKNVSVRSSIYKDYIMMPGSKHSVFYVRTSA